MAESKKVFYEIVAEKLIEQLKAGTAPWQKPWVPGDPKAFLPMNPSTGKRYKGINSIHLMTQDYVDQRWMTYRQATAAGAQVRKGEKGTPVQHWKFSEEHDKVDANGRPVLDGQGQPVKETVLLERPSVFFATVFNAEQIDGLPPIERKPRTWDAIERAEQILQASGATIRHGENNRAFYRLSNDSIHLPDPGQFPTADRYYATALHELGHWTGHASRLDRDLSHPFGSEGYAKEELRAEIASMILGDELGIGHDPKQHAAYVGSWIKSLEEDPLEIFRAAAAAEKIHDYVLAFEQTLDQVQNQEESQQRSPPQVTAQRPAHEMTLAEFAEQATVEALTDHGRRWNVSLDDRFAGFSDADSPLAAIADVHRAAVNNALYLNAPESTGISLQPTLPPPAVLADYPDLVAQYPHVQEQENKMQIPSRSATTFSDDTVADHVGVDRVLSGNADAAEAWTMNHLGRSTLSRVLDGASLEQIDRLIQVVNDMQPLNTQNAFWDRHALPQDVEALEAKIERANDELEQRGFDAMVAAARRDLKTATATSLEQCRDAFDQAAINALEFTLPHDWNGRVVVQGNVYEEIDGERRAMAAYFLGVEPRVWGLYAQPETGSRKWLADFETQAQAEAMAERLALIDANSESNELEKAVKLARIQEERVRRDPESSDEAVSAAKEARKAAEATALLNAADFKRRDADQEREQRERQQGRAVEQKAERTYIDVPFKAKDEAKNLGARWDRQQQSWYVPNGVDAAPFAKWFREEGVSAKATEPTEATPDHGQKNAPERVYLAVPYGERAAAKAAGALWDKAAKSWYAGAETDMTRLERWRLENIAGQQGPAMAPREEFAEALRSVGCLVSGEHPVMDGKTHRISVEGDKRGEHAGFYVGHVDGHPAGYIKNNRTGVDMKWKAKGYVLDPAEKARLQAEAATRRGERTAEQERLHEATAQRVVRLAESLVPVSEPTAYLQAKGIAPQAGALTDRDGQKTYLPAIDASEKQWTMQYILEDGTKRFARDSRKEGCFHPVGGMPALAAAPVLVIAEGYATAATLSEALGQATVAAFDSGNLPHVARALHAKFPDKPVIIASDDDRHLEITQGINPGRIKAEEAARAVGGKAIFPIFAPGENAYPANLEPITPQTYREHERAAVRLEAAQKESEKVRLSEQEMRDLKQALLSGEQLAALGAMKAHTDFNDVATRSALGRDGVERQAKAAVGQALQAREQKPERALKLVKEQGGKPERKREQRLSRSMKVG